MTCSASATLKKMGLPFHSGVRVAARVTDGRRRLLHRGMEGRVRRVGTQTSVSSSGKGWEQGGGTTILPWGRKKSSEDRRLLSSIRPAVLRSRLSLLQWGRACTPKRGTRKFRRHGHRAIRAARQPLLAGGVIASDGCLVSPSRNPRRTCRAALQAAGFITYSVTNEIRDESGPPETAEMPSASLIGVYDRVRWLPYETRGTHEMITFGCP
jgi:hypothetical protein